MSSRSQTVTKIETCDPRWISAVGQYRTTKENFGPFSVSGKVLCHQVKDNTGAQVCDNINYLKQIYDVTCVSTDSTGTTSQCIATEKQN